LTIPSNVHSCLLHGITSSTVEDMIGSLEFHL